MGAARPKGALACLALSMAVVTRRAAAGAQASVRRLRARKVPRATRGWRTRRWPNRCVREGAGSQGGAQNEVTQEVGGRAAVCARLERYGGWEDGREGHEVVVMVAAAWLAQHCRCTMGHCRPRARGSVHVGGVDPHAPGIQISLRGALLCGELVQWALRHLRAWFMRAGRSDQWVVSCGWSPPQTARGAATP